MRREARGTALLLLGIGCAAGYTPAQKPPEQNVTVVLLNTHEQPPQPVRAVRVSLSYLDSSVLVTDAQQVTNSQGQALLLVSSGVAQRGDLRIEVSGATDLVIYQPADGQLTALPAMVKVNLLPRGSPALLGPAQIEAMLHRTLLQVNNLQKENRALKAQAAQAQNQRPDLSGALAAWAQANGFSSAQVDEQVQQWAQNIQRQAAQATAEQKALAEVALKHYASAAQLFNQAADSDADELDAEEQAFLNGRRDKLRQLIGDREQAASAYQLNLQYRQATQTLESAQTTAAAEYKKHPGDKGFHELWLRAALSAADARAKEGMVSAASDSLRLLAQSADDDRMLAREYADLGDRPGGAAAQDRLGIALLREGERAGGEKSAALLDQSVEAFRKALDVYTKADLPRDWARAENNLGVALQDEGERAGGDKAIVLLNQAVEGYKSALEVYTKADLPQDWANTQVNLGIALMDEGERAASVKVVALFDQSLQAYRNALEVYTKADFPQDWARAQNDLGIALEDEARRSGGDKVAALLDQAAQAYRNALDVYTKAELPQDWARGENNLGNVLLQEGKRAGGDKALALFDQAVEAYRKALEVYTKADLPQNWAVVENGMGNALEREGERAGGEKAAALFGQAVEAYRSALEVITKADLPQNWAVVEDSLGNALEREGERAGGDKAAGLLDQAVEAYRSALEVFTRADLPQSWAAVETGLGNALMQEGERASEDRAAALFDQSVEAYRATLLVYTKADLPQNWATMQTNLGEVFMLEGERAGGDKSAALLNQAAEAYKNALDVYTKADLPRQWAMTHLNLEEAGLAAGGFTGCIQESEIVTDDTLSSSSLFVRDSLKLACLWGSGDKSAAQATEKAVLGEAPMVQMGAWDFTGVIHVLSTAPAFEKGRSSWVALFTAAQNGDSAGVAGALRQLEPLIQN